MNSAGLAGDSETEGQVGDTEVGSPAGDAGTGCLAEDTEVRGPARDTAEGPASNAGAGGSAGDAGAGGSAGDTAEGPASNAGAGGSAGDTAEGPASNAGAGGSAGDAGAGGSAGEVGAGRRAGRRRSRGGRRVGGSGTREAILAAARGQFADYGYYGATIRGIAAVAEVDPALVHHFYGTKEALFSAAMRLPVVPSEVLTAALAPQMRPPDSELGEHLVRTALSLWESGQFMETFVGLLRSAVTNEQAAVMLREFIADSILGTLVRLTGLGDLGSSAEAEYRVAMVATQMIGLALARLVFKFPAVAGASVDELAATIGPTVGRYLNGDIALRDWGSPAPSARASADISEL